MKNKEILLDVIGDTSPELIPDISSGGKKRGKIKWFALGTGAFAAAVIACIAFLPGGGKSPGKISPYSGLPGIRTEKNPGSEIISSEVSSGGMGYGFEGLLAYDISELDRNDPWNEEAGITELPVYKNLAYTGNEGGRTKIYLTEAQMTEIAKNTAASLGTDITAVETEYLDDIMVSVPEKYSGSVYIVKAECSDKTKINVYGNGQIKIDFGSISLPEKYSFTYGETSAEEAEDTLEYLSEKYAALLDYDEPMCCTYAERSYSGEELRSYYVYDASGDMSEDILNFSISNARFCPDDNGNLMCVWLNNGFCASEYMGEYPIISYDDAKAELLADDYFSTVPPDYIKDGRVAEEDIVKCEIIYRDNEAYYQPYYRFFVELEDPGENTAEGLKDYGVFYVPAVKAEYREPTELRFN